MVCRSTSPMTDVVIAGPTVFAGYRLRPDLTAATLVGGRLITQDKGFLGPDGRLEVIGRFDDVVVTGGVNVSLAAVEGMLNDQPGVVESAVVALPDADWGQRIVAYVVASFDLDVMACAYRFGPGWDERCPGTSTSSTSCHTPAPASGPPSAANARISAMTTAAEWPARDLERCRPRLRRSRRQRCGCGSGPLRLVGGAARAGRLAGVAGRRQLANDYSDGIRGPTRTESVRSASSARVPPRRKRSRRRPSPRSVWRPQPALLLVIATATYELLVIGAACLVAAWWPAAAAVRLSRPRRAVRVRLLRTGRGDGNNHVQVERLTATSAIGGVGCGALACAILVVNNLRDIPTDVVAGKRTLAVVLGMAVPATCMRHCCRAFVSALVLAVTAGAWAALALPVPLAARPLRAVRSGARGRGSCPRWRGPDSCTWPTECCCAGLA